MIEPWFQFKDFVEGRIFMQTYDDEDYKICRMSKSNKRDNLSILTFYYQVLSKSGEMENFAETHHVGLFIADEMNSWLPQSGFTATFNE